jgi:hypothetical protein
MVRPSSGHKTWRADENILNTLHGQAARDGSPALELDGGANNSQQNKGSFLYEMLTKDMDASVGGISFNDLGNAKHGDLIWNLLSQCLQAPAQSSEQNEH